MPVLAFNPRSLQSSQGAISPDDLHAQLVQWVDDAESYFYEPNERAQRDRDYYDGRQWSEEDAQDRQSLGRAVICINRIARKVRFMKGFEAANRTSAKALPRTPAHEQSADTITEGLRYVADLTRIDQKFSNAYEYLLIEGIEAIEVGARQSPDNSIDPDAILIPWDRFIYDPYSREKDFSDARYLGKQAWYDLDTAVAKWTQRESVLQGAVNDYVNSEIYEDRPQWNINTTDRQRLRVVALYFKQGVTWMYALFCRSGWIEEPAPSVFVDEYGHPECPIIAGCALINTDNERYGFVREMIDVQDEINVRHSNDIDFSKMRQTVGEKGAVADVNESKRELQKPNGHVEITRGLRFDVLPTSDLASRNLEALTLAKNEIELMGPNAAMIGKDNRAPSGRAIIASQEGGTYELSPFMDCHHDFKLRVYRAIWHRIKQFWQSEKWIRVTDDEDKLRFIGLNAPVTYGQLIAQQNGGQIPPEMQIQYGPLLNQQAYTQNHVAYLDMDIVIDDVAHSAIVQQEQFDNLINLAKIAGPQIPFTAILQASSIRDKDKIIKEIKDSQQQQQQAQVQQAELLAKRIASEIENNLASSRQKDADALAKTLQAQIQGLQAQTYHLLTPPVQPPSVLQSPPMMAGPGMMPMQPNSPPPGMEGQEPPMMGDMQQGAGPMIQPPPPGVLPGDEVMRNGINQ